MSNSIDNVKIVRLKIFRSYLSSKSKSIFMCESFYLMFVTSSTDKKYNI